MIDGKSVDDWIVESLQLLETMPNVDLRRRTMGAGVYDHGYVLAYERLTDHAPDPNLPRHRLWRIRAREVLTTTGAIERGLSFAGNDIPGVMLASAMRDYVVNQAISPGERVVIVTNNDDAYRTALALHRVGVDAPMIVDARAGGGGALAAEAEALGIRVEPGKAIARVNGHNMGYRSRLLPARSR